MFDIRPSHGTGRLRVSLVPVQCGAGGCGVSMVEASGVGAARLRFEVVAVAPLGT